MNIIRKKEEKKNKRILDAKNAKQNKVLTKDRWAKLTHKFLEINIRLAILNPTQKNIDSNKL